MSGGSSNARPTARSLCQGRQPLGSHRRADGRSSPSRLIRESALVRFFGICFADKCDRPDRPRLCREGEEGAARMLEAAEADLAIEAGSLSERRARHSRKFGRQVRRRKQTAFSGFAMAASVLSLAARLTELHRSCGTEPPLDMLMTLQGVYEKSLGTLSPSPRRAPRWTRFGQLASSIYRSLTERLPRQHSAW
jgi:hypothetical protein